MNYLSVCSGIEAATVAWHPLGWNPVGFSEIESFPSQVLKHHYPTVPNLGDMTKFKEWEIESNIDVFVGGTPCQSFSVAGLRKGLDDPRGNLMLTYLAIADKFRPKWLVWENVPGVLSSNGGKDFGTFLGGLGELGYGFAYRILDAQYFGVAQRRRRVFVVGYLGDWRPAAAVLFERDSLQGNPAPSREKRESTAIGTRAVPEGYGIDRVEVVNALCASDSKGVGNQYLADHKCVVQPIAIAENTIGRQPHNGGNGDGFTNGGPMYTLNASGVHGVAQPLSYDMKQHHNPQPSDTVQLTTSNCATVRGDTPLVQPIAFEPGKLKRLGYGDSEPGLAPSLRAQAGDNQLAVAHPITFSSVLSNQPINSKLEVSQTLEAKNPTAVAYNIAPGKGELKDDIHVTDAYIAKTIDASGSNPAMHQGGAAIVQPISFDTYNLQAGNISQTLQSRANNEAIGTVFTPNQTAIAFGFDAYNQTIQGEVNQPLRVSSAPGQVDAVGGVVQGMAVRRLTPVECERLQGFPDNYTDIKSKNKPTPDGPRYKALGNSMAVPVMAWIGQRIQKVEDIIK
jgi:site-specific DNA-cytosine methylase